MDWLIKGESPMIRKNIIHGNNNGINSNEGKIGTFVSGDNHKTVVGNLEINDPGFEKIINENEVEIIGSHEPTVIHLRHEIEILKKENEKLMSESSSKDKIIEAKDQTINILQSFIGKK